MKLPCYLAAVTAALIAGPAQAALSDSEKAQVRDLYAKADAPAAARVGALLARPDLSAAESAAAFTDATRRVTFSTRRAAFVKSLLYGPATAASRSELVPAVVQALLARAAEVAAAAGEDPARRADELLAIHGFVAREIASGGRPPLAGHDPALGIRDEALKEAVVAYRAHLALPVFERARLPPPLLVARTQAEVALIELAVGLFPPSEVAAWITSHAQEREAFERTGVLVVGLAGAPATKATAVVSMLQSAGAAASGASVLWIGKPWPRGLSARRAVLVAQAPLAGSKRVAPSRIWSSAIEPSSPDAALAETAFVLGRAAAAHRQLASVGAAPDTGPARGEAGVLSAALQLQALEPERQRQGAAVAPTLLAAHAAQLLLLDAPRALSLALVHAAVGRMEPVEQLALGLSVIASGADGQPRDEVTAGRVVDSGGVVPVEISKIRSTGGRVDRFTIEGHDYALQRAADGRVQAVQRDGKPVDVPSIPFARLPTIAAESWPLSSRKGDKAEAPVLRRLFGKPEVGLPGDDRIVVRSAPTPGRAAVMLVGPSDEIDVELELTCHGAPGALILRASAGSTSYAGVAVFVEPGDAPRGWVVALDGSGGKFPLTNPTPLAKPGPRGHRIKATLKRDGVRVTVGDRTLSAALPSFLVGGGGNVGFAPGEPGELDIRALELRPVLSAKPGASKR
jgi:hypothetical protein